MVPFTIYDRATGQVLSVGTAQEEALEALESEERGVFAGVAFDGGYFIGDVHHPLPPQPSPVHTFNWTTKAWEDQRSVADARERKWSRVKNERHRREFSVFAWEGLLFDCDQISQQRIQGAAQLATLAKINALPFSINWTLADNSVETLDADEMISVGMTMGGFIDSLHEISRLKRLEIEAANTIAEVDAIADW